MEDFELETSRYEELTYDDIKGSILEDQSLNDKSWRKLWTPYVDRHVLDSSRSRRGNPFDGLESRADNPSQSPTPRAAAGTRNPHPITTLEDLKASIANMKQ
jgi:hypothetical protein